MTKKGGKLQKKAVEILRTFHFYLYLLFRQEIREIPHFPLPAGLPDPLRSERRNLWETGDFHPAVIPPGNIRKRKSSPDGRTGEG